MTINTFRNGTIKNLFVAACVFLMLTITSCSNKTSKSESISSNNTGGGSLFSGITITVDANSKMGTFRNITGGVNIWENPERKTENGELLKKFMSEIGPGQFFQTRTFLGYVTETLDNYFIIEGIDDSQNLKTASDLIHSSGGKLMLNIVGVPRWLSTCDFADIQKECDNIIGPVPEYSKYPPSDYDKWDALIKGLITKLDQLGIVVDYFSIYGEANIGTTWWGDGSLDVIPSFLEHYKQTVNAIRSVKPDAKVGGVSFASGHVPLNLNNNYATNRWTRDFIDYSKNNKVPLDFYTWHSYTTRTEIFEDDAQSIRNYLDVQGFKDTLLFVTEWGAEGRGQILGDKATTHFGSSFITAGLMKLSDSVNNGQNYYTILDGTAQFGLFHSESQPKAAYNAVRLFSMINGDKIDVTSDEASYELKLWGVDFPQQDIKMLATLDSNSKSIFLLVTDYVPIETTKDEPNYDLSKEIKILINSIPFNQYTYKIYLIDSDHSNGYTGDTYELEIIEGGQGSSAFQKELTLPIYGVLMVQINAN